MKIEQYIQKLLVEQTTSGWWIKIFGSETFNGEKANKAAKTAGAYRGVFIKARNVTKTATSTDDMIIQDIIATLEQKPAVLGPGGEYDTLKYMYVILPLKTMFPKKIKKFFMFIIERARLNEYIKVLDYQIKSNSYFKTKSSSYNFKQLANINVYTSTQYQDLLKQLELVTKLANDPVVNSLFDKLKKSLPDVSRFINLTFDDDALSTSGMEKVTIDDLTRTYGFKGEAYKVTVPETGETILFPIEGIQTIKQLYGKPGRGIFYGKFNNKGLPESGEVWYSSTNLNNKEAPVQDQDYVTSDHFGGFVYFNGLLWPTFSGDPLDPSFTFKYKDGEFHFEDGEKYIGTVFEKSQRPNNGTFYNKDGTKKATAKDGEFTLTAEEIARIAKAKAAAEVKAKADAEAKKKKDAETTKKNEKERVEKIKNKTFKYPFIDARVKELGVTQKKVHEKDGYVYFISNNNNNEIRSTTKKDFEATYKDLSKKELVNALKNEIPDDIKNALKFSLTWKDPNANITLYRKNGSLFIAQKIAPLGKELTNVIAKDVFETNGNKFIQVELTYKFKRSTIWVNQNSIKKV